VASGVSLNEYCSHFDSISVCLSKGLGAPVGSVIAGSKDFINEAFRVRKGWGGGMRQVGILAAAGLYAVKNNISRLSEDHEKAKILSRHIYKTGMFEINLDNVQTNILIFKPKNISVEEALQKCEDNGLLLSVGQVGTLRAVTHMDVSFDDVSRACNILSKVFN
jgi:threonine aldolase